MRSGFHGFPGTWDSEAAHWAGWENGHLAEMRAILARYNRVRRSLDHRGRLFDLDAATRWNSSAGSPRPLAAPADRLYWYGWQDIAARCRGAGRAVVRSAALSPRRRRSRMARRSCWPGSWARGRARPCRADRRALRPGDGARGPARADHRRRRLHRLEPRTRAFSSDGRDVVVLDNLSRAGVEDQPGLAEGPHTARGCTRSRSTCATNGRCGRRWRTRRRRRPSTSPRRRR